MVQIREILLVALGGGLGSVLRFGLGRITLHPFGTLLANGVACMVLGLLTSKLASNGAQASSTWRLLIGIGFCGGLSTFSTLMVELVQYQQQGSIGHAMGYLALSLCVGLGFLALGLWLGR